MAAERKQKIHKKFHTGRRALTAIVILAGLLIGARAYLPVWLTGYVNRNVEALDGYGGGVQDIDVHLIRGGYDLKGLNIYKDSGGLREPFLSADTIALSVQWRALFKRRIVAEVDARNFEFNFSKTQTGSGAGWGRLVDALSPLDINRLEVAGGRVEYVDYMAEPNIHLYIDDIHARITNIGNVDRKDSALPSDVSVKGQSIGGGSINLAGQANLLRDIPDFDLNLELEDADLTAFNAYVNEAMAVDFESGNVSIYSELAAAGGAVSGYVKPIADNVHFVDIGGQDTNPLNILWESIVSGFTKIFKNHPQDQFAFNVPIEGNLKNPEQDKWAAFISIFKNAFGRAFPRDTDGNINFQDALRQSTARE